MPFLSGGESFVNLLAKNNALTKANATEDSCFASILLIVDSGSNNYARLAPFLEWARWRTGAAFNDVPALTDSLFVARSRTERFVNPFALEFFSQSLFRRLGIPTAPARIVATRDARSLDGSKFIVKFATRNPYRLVAKLDAEDLSEMFDRNGWCLVSEVVPDAATIDYVRRKLFPGSEPTEGIAATFYRVCNKTAQGNQNFVEFTERVLGKECVAADRLYENFHPDDSQRESIWRAIRWNSDPYLKICAARIFVGCSAPHASNVLVTAPGDLISVDHCTGQFEGGKDLEMLFRFVRRDSRAFGLLNDIARLGESDVREAVDSIPKHPACGSLIGLADYFAGRLRLWKELFSGRPAPVQEAAHTAA